MMALPPDLVLYLSMAAGQAEARLKEHHKIEFGTNPTCYQLGRPVPGI